MSYRQHVLIGCSEPTLILLFETLVGDRDGHTLFTAASTLDQLTQQAIRTSFDAAIVVLDSIIVPTNSPATHIDVVLDAVSRIQVRAPMPVTVMLFSFAAVDLLADHTLLQIRLAATRWQCPILPLKPRQTHTVEHGRTSPVDDFAARTAVRKLPTATD